MRATVTIDDDMLAAARALAARKGYSLGRALSELARRGFTSATPVRKREDDTVFAVPADATTITNGDVHRSLADWP